MQQEVGGKGAERKGRGMVGLVLGVGVSRRHNSSVSRGTCSSSNSSIPTNPIHQIIAPHAGEGEKAPECVAGNDGWGGTTKCVGSRWFGIMVRGGGHASPTARMGRRNMLNASHHPENGGVDRG